MKLKVLFLLNCEFPKKIAKFFPSVYYSSHKVYSEVSSIRYSCHKDGTPPGPGTVTSWYGGKRSSNQVMVNWDRGTSANYRIGAHGKYDLYLLADQSPATKKTKTKRKITEIDAPDRDDIQPIFGPDLEEAIKIGSRVVRGKDWSWGNQDGDPPTPGTVESWYRGNKSSKEVYVRWDSGRRVNYRVGAHGKYDLYLLKDQ